MTNKRQKKVPIHFTIDSDIKDTFYKICERDGYTATLVMRKMIEQYIAKNGQSDLFKF